MSPSMSERYGWIRSPTLSSVDVEETISYYRKKAAKVKVRERELCHTLLCSNDPAHHAEAFELASRNTDQVWGRLFLFKMYFNGVGTKRDIKAALRVFYTGGELRPSKGPGI